MKKTLAVLTALFVASSVGFTFADDMSPKNRLENQHDRVHDGVKDGTISKKEHRKLVKEGRKINHQRKADLRKDGGKLDKKDRKHLEKEENNRSNQIYKDKHN
ncbi:MAG TPA: hypothetical protein VIJ93_10295 [bacterium]